jgi:hypothetical protein
MSVGVDVCLLAKPMSVHDDSGMKAARLFVCLCERTLKEEFEKHHPDVILPVLLQ